MVGDKKNPSRLRFERRRGMVRWCVPRRTLRWHFEQRRGGAWCVMRRTPPLAFRATERVVDDTEVVGEEINPSAHISSDRGGGG